MATKRSASKKRINLRDVIFHIQGVKQDLSRDMQHMEHRLLKKFDEVHTRINEVESNLTERIKDSDKDIMAVMTDTINIRRHVGMALPDDE